MICIKNALGIIDDKKIQKLKLTEEDFSKLFLLSKKFSLDALFIYSMKKNKIFKGTELESTIQTLFLKSIYEYENKLNELGKLCSLLEESEVPYIKLKGARIKSFYPEEFLRTSCDIDILIHRKDIEKAENALVSKLGYFKKIDNYHDVGLLSPNNIYLELHFNIKEAMPQMDKVLETVWDNSYKAGEGSEYLQTNEFFVFHNIAHMAYHFASGGCGIRPFIDLYLLENKLEYDKETLEGLCKEAGINTFYSCAQELMGVWFNEKEHTELTKAMEKYILEGGTYGSFKNSIASGQNHSGGKSGYLLKRIFMPYNTLKGIYPIIEKHKMLTPVYEVKRWIDRLVGKDLSRYFAEVKINNAMEQGDVERIASLFDELELRK